MESIVSTMTVASQSVNGGLGSTSDWALVLIGLVTAGLTYSAVRASWRAAQASEASAKATAETAKSTKETLIFQYSYERVRDFDDAMDNLIRSLDICLAACQFSIGAELPIADAVRNAFNIRRAIHLAHSQFAGALTRVLEYDIKFFQGDYRDTLNMLSETLVDELSWIEGKIDHIVLQCELEKDVELIGANRLFKSLETAVYNFYNAEDNPVDGLKSLIGIVVREAFQAEQI